MIVKMKKYTFLVYHKEYEKFLKEIQELGVVHVVEKTGESADAVRKKIQLQKRIDSALKLLKTRFTDAHYSKEIKKDEDPVKIISEIEDLQLDIEQNQQKLHHLNKEYSSIHPWGDFSVKTLKKLKEKGVEVRFFISPEKMFDQAVTEKYTAEVIARKAGNVYFAVFVSEDEDLDLKAEEIKQFEKSLSEITEEISKVKRSIEEDNKKLDKTAYDFYLTIEKFSKIIDNEKHYLQILEEGRAEAGDKIRVLEGWIPVTREDSAEKYLDDHGVLYLKSEAAEEDISSVPILMQNSRFAKLFEPIGKLFSLPAYNEIDLTVFFAPFYALFFGFCLGDAGYGIALLLAGTIGKLKLKEDIKPILTLVQILGVMTVIMGAVGGTFFGVDLKLLDWKFKDVFLDSNTMFWLALGLGLVQIIFGMSIKAANQIRQKGWIYSVSTFGWIIMSLSFAGMSIRAILGYLRVDQAVIDSASYLNTISSISGKTVLIGVAMILLFNDPKANIFMRILKGMWQLYDITGVFGDLLSYIRLFALGTSGAILGFVVNRMAESFFEIPYLGWAIGLIFMIIGHTGNILLSGLGSFVHPMRLTFVEFYKNSGWTGGGKPYKPFKKV